MALEKVYDYFHNYDKQTYQVVACMGNEPSEQDIKNFENQYGINLPSDFREFTMSPLGGLFLWPQGLRHIIHETDGDSAQYTPPFLLSAKLRNHYNADGRI